MNVCRRQRVNPSGGGVCLGNLVDAQSTMPPRAQAPAAPGPAADLSPLKGGEPVPNLDLPPLVVLAGPTATGKSELALELCAGGRGEIISADSAVVYRGLDIGTGKPTPAERAAVVHHLIDIRDPGESFSVADYRGPAEAAIRSCVAARRWPVMVGGTGLYIRQVLETPELPDVPPHPEIRAELARRPPAALYAALSAADPVAASGIHPANLRRVIRALEVLQVTGRPISEAWAASRRIRRKAAVVVLDRPQGVLRERIAARVDRMLEAGLIPEVRRLLESGVPPEAQSLQALGYRQIVRYLREGGTPTDLREAIITATAQYAKRQRTWFRREPGAVWIELGDGPAKAALSHIQDLCTDWEDTGQKETDRLR